MPRQQYDSGFTPIPTLGDHLIAFLMSSRMSGTYRRILRERLFSRVNKNSIRTTLYRLEKQGMLLRNGDVWFVTEMGRNSKKQRYAFIASPFRKNSPDHAIVCFDIPETQRRARDWLRDQLKIFGYRMVQQSVWVGPGPLPAEFKSRTKELNISGDIQMFRISGRQKK